MIQFYTRFSVINKSMSSSWHASKEISFDAYVKKIMDENRLKDRLNIFLNHTCNHFQKAYNNNQKFQHILLTSTLLPSWAKIVLSDSAKRYSWLKINYLAPDEEFNISECLSNWLLDEKMLMHQKDLYLATVRLDDDDLLADSFIEKLSFYIKPAFLGFCVSFPQGYYGLHDGRKYLAFTEKNMPKIALGLSYITHYSFTKKKFMTAYTMPPGTHTEVDKRAPTILDSSFPAYIRTINGKNDSFVNADGYLFGGDISKIKDKYFSSNLIQSNVVSQYFTSI